MSCPWYNNPVVPLESALLSRRAAAAPGTGRVDHIRFACQYMSGPLPVDSAIASASIASYHATVAWFRPEPRQRPDKVGIRPAALSADLTVSARDKAPAASAITACSMTR
jgi:hypothetical protein